MIGPGPIRASIANAEFRQAMFLMLAVALMFLTHLCHADNYYTPEEKARIGDVENYIRKQGMQGMTLLPGDVRSAIGWFSGGWHPMIGGGDDDAPPASNVPQGAPGSALAAMQEDSSDLPPMHIAGNFHHKGFLPTHDAAVMGIGLGQNAFDNKLQFTAHPFYGQNWRSLQGYWGGEMAMNIAQREDGMPWGKIVLGYVQGNDALVDNGRGMDLHGDVDLTEGWKFTSGLRQNSVDGNSNYVMLRWKMGFD